MRNLERISEEIHEKRQTPRLNEFTNNSASDRLTTEDDKDDSSAPPSDPEDIRGDRKLEVKDKMPSTKTGTS